MQVTLQFQIFDCISLLDSAFKINMKALNTSKLLRETDEFKSHYQMFNSFIYVFIGFWKSSF